MTTPITGSVRSGDACCPAMPAVLHLISQERHRSVKTIRTVAVHRQHWGMRSHRWRAAGHPGGPIPEPARRCGLTLIAVTHDRSVGPAQRLVVMRNGQLSFSQDRQCGCAFRSGAGQVAVGRLS